MPGPPRASFAHEIPCRIARCRVGSGTPSRRGASLRYRAPMLEGGGASPFSNGGCGFANVRQHRWRTLDQCLGAAERAIALLDRCCPKNLASEALRLRAGWQAGQEVVPEWRYAPSPDLHEWSRMLERVIEVLNEEEGAGALYARRAEELLTEVRLVEAIGTPRFRSLAKERFAEPEARHAAQAAAWARRWAGREPVASAALVRSDDLAHPDSLVSRMRREIGALRLPVRVEVRMALTSAAASADGVVVVRGGVYHCPMESERIVLHEIAGHILPRARSARAGGGLLRIGTAGASADEEGRALLLERRAGLLGPTRRRALAHRHLAATAVRAGADWVETVRAVLDRGATRTEAIDVSIRAHRGGGLAREAVYLSALSRVSEAFAADPELEVWLENGRTSVDAARQLRAVSAEGSGAAGDERLGHRLAGR